MSKIFSNLKFLRLQKGLSQEQMAESLGITRSRLGAYEENRNEPSIDLLITISDFFHIAVDALVRGDLTKTNLDGLMKIGKNRMLFPVVIDEDGRDAVELVPLKASAGYLRGYADPEYMERLPRMKLPFLPSGKHRAFPIKGDSMPPIKEGSFVVAKYLDRIEDIKNGQTYIVVTKEDGISYKRIFNVNTKKGFMECHSDNKIYPPFNVSLKDVLEVWEYTCCINMTDYREEELNVGSIMSMLRNLQVEMEVIKKQGKKAIS
ncbi:MAG: helix-turn-helix domain-containing protein [Bacteroidetes bacterium]|jgi:transcriptional regulator with XRE-family HTH domain|nr:helix-turn-helix domain-containing protein [Bacteroidota bacterium]